VHAVIGRRRRVGISARLVVTLAVGVSFAVAAFPAAASQDGALVDSLLARAGRALNAGEADRAEELFDQVLSVSKDEPRAEHGLAVVGLMRGDSEAAIEHARRAIKKDKKNSGYHLTLAYGYGIKAMEGGLKALFYAGKYKEECELAIKYDPENVDAHMGVLQYYVMAPGLMGGGADKAEETVATIASIDPMKGYLARGFVAECANDLEGAEKAYLSAAAVDTLDPEGWKALAGFYAGEHRYEEAIDIGERVVRLDPDDLGAVYQLAKARLMSGIDLDAAESGFRRYIESEKRPREPDLASAHWRLGMVYEKRGDRRAARGEWEQALALDPGHEKAAADLDTLRAEHPELW
jgi:tetratricopeptide (TPR) repeat protein